MKNVVDMFALLLRCNFDLVTSTATVPQLTVNSKNCPLSGCGQQGQIKLTEWRSAIESLSIRSDHYDKIMWYTSL